MSLPYPANSLNTRLDLSALSNAQHPVVFFANGYGDHYLNLPAIRALVEHYQGRLTLFGMPGAMEHIAVSLNIKQLITVPMKHSNRGRLFDADHAAELIPKCDLFISLNPWFNDDLRRLLDCLHQPTSMGFFAPFSICVQRDYNKHSVDLTFDVVQRICADYTPEQFSQSPQYRQADIEMANSIAAALPVDKKIMCIHVDTLPEKMWPEQAWKNFLDAFLDLHPDFCVLMVGVNGIDSARCKHADAIVHACGLSIPVSGLLLAKSALFVGIDSVFLHIADLWRVPAVGLFGPTKVSEWGVRFGPAKHVSNSDGMSAISIDEALIATQQLLDEQIIKKLVLTHKHL